MEYTEQQKRFIEKARETISDNPNTRIGPKIKEVIDANNFVFDAHCHVFDGDCVSVLYLSIRLLLGVQERFRGLVWRLITRQGANKSFAILSLEEMAEQLMVTPEMIPEKNDMDKFLDQLENEIDAEEAVSLDNKSFTTLGIREVLVRIRNIIRLIRSKRMSDVYKGFETDYAINHVYNRTYQTDKDQITIVLGMDLNMGWEHTSEKTNLQQNAELGQLAAEYPVLPYLPLDPRRCEHQGNKNLYEIFLNAFNKETPTFFGVKCYPSLGYLPSDSRLKPIFQICAEKNIPVITHCGGEMISTFKKKIPVNRDGVTEYINLSPRKARARFLNEPKEWIPVLEAQPTLKLCLGHFGGKEAWEKSDGVTGHRVSTILEMMERFNHLYADFAFNLESYDATKALKRKLEENTPQGELMRARTLFGTDFWVVLPVSDLNADQGSFLREMGDLSDQLVTNNVKKYLGL